MSAVAWESSAASSGQGAEPVNLEEAVEKTEWDPEVGGREIEDHGIGEGVADVVIMTPSKKGSEQSPPGSQHGGGEQCSHCTREGSVASMINYGCRNYPKYRCKACHAAVRYLERAAKSRGTVHYDSFCEHRRRSPLKFTQAVLLCRMAPQGEQPLPGADDVPEMGKCKSSEERAQRASAVVTSVYHLRATEEFQEILYLTERQFRSHMRWNEDMSKEEAQQAWDSALLNKEQEQRYHNGVLQVAVLTKVGKRHIQQKGSKRALEKHGSMSDSDLDNAENVGKRMRSHADADVSHLQKDLSCISNAFVAPEVQKSSGAGAQSVAQILTNLSGIPGDASSNGGDSVAAKCGIVRPDGEALKAMGLTKANVEVNSKWWLDKITLQKEAKPR
eukprot:6492546-Amphidinium_carterae.3